MPFNTLMCLLRVFIVGFQNFQGDVFDLFVIVSIITMTYGNLAASTSGARTLADVSKSLCIPSFLNITTMTLR